MNDKVKYYQVAVEVYKKVKIYGANKSDSINNAYELQAGSYTSDFYKSKFYTMRNNAFHAIIEKYCTLFEVLSVRIFGIGETVNWVGFDGYIDDFYGIKLSYSRLMYADNNLSKLSKVLEW